ncbi:MAG: HAD-IIB family hydrolase [Candidatus Rokubacteria bacterium]|nr:HAD-IIB family hydrolase [Candidatus Rokubacteria bacterium]
MMWIDDRGGPKFVIYSDLDGCLLDRESYKFDAARPALDLLNQEAIPLVLCSSKTQAEVEYHRELLGLRDPFVVENGGAILIPEGYFPFRHAFTRSTGGNQLVEFGVSYTRLTEALRDIRWATGVRLRGFSEMSLEDLVFLTGLSPEAARRAKARRYDEPFVADLTGEEAERLGFEVRRRGLTLTRGWFYHLTGGNTKGLAVDFLTRLYRSRVPHLTTVGFGDAANDLSMLQSVDIPVVIPRGRLALDPAFEGRHWTVASAPGPAGWAQVVQALLTGERETLKVS